jgi:hypothetical protein
MVENEMAFMEFLLGRKMARIKRGTLWGIWHKQAKRSNLEDS